MTHATAIEWMTALADAKGMRADVWNWVEGCTAAGEGCRNCWAAAEVYIRGHQSGKVGERFGGLAEMRGGRPVFLGAVRVIESDLTKPLRTKRPTAYFCSRFDPFHEAIIADIAARWPALVEASSRRVCRREHTEVPA